MSKRRSIIIRGTACKIKAKKTGAFASIAFDHSAISPELFKYYYIFLSRWHWWDLNPLPWPYESPALNTELQSLILRPYTTIITRDVKLWSNIHNN